MNRREFLQQFAVSLAAAPLILNGVEEEDWDDKVASGYLPERTYTVRSYDGPPYVMDFHAQGNGGPSSKHGLVGLTRNYQGFDLFDFPIGETLIVNSLSAWGGFMRWIPYPGNELYMPEGHPIACWSTNPEIKAYALIRQPGINCFTVLES